MTQFSIIYVLEYHYTDKCGDRLLSLTPKLDFLDTAAQADISQPVSKYSLAVSVQHCTWTNVLVQWITTLDASVH